MLLKSLREAVLEANLELVRRGWCFIPSAMFQEWTASRGWW